MSGDAGARRGGRRIALLLEYDGTAYRGSQYQENDPSIQSALEAAINNLTGTAARAAFAGRTDSGVHALGQVATFDTDASMSEAAFVTGLNHFLADDIAVRAAREVDAAFDPRHDALRRRYRYRIENRPVRSPLLRHRAWAIERAIDVDAMRRAAAVLIGKHDFAAFAGPYEGSTVRTLERCDVTRRGCGTFWLELEARSFLPHQVRRIAGALVEAGVGKTDEAAMARQLEEARPSSAGPQAPACGLYLAHIEYDGLDWGPLAGNGLDG